MLEWILLFSLGLFCAYIGCRALRWVPLFIVLAWPAAAADTGSHLTLVNDTPFPVPRWHAYNESTPGSGSYDNQTGSGEYPFYQGNLGGQVISASQATVLWAEPDYTWNSYAPTPTVWFPGDAIPQTNEYTAALEVDVHGNYWWNIDVPGAKGAIRPDNGGPQVTFGMSDTNAPFVPQPGSNANASVTWTQNMNGFTAGGSNVMNARDAAMLAGLSVQVEQGNAAISNALLGEWSREVNTNLFATNFGSVDNGPWQIGLGATLSEVRDGTGHNWDPHQWAAYGRLASISWRAWKCIILVGLIWLIKEWVVEGEELAFKIPSVFPTNTGGWLTALFRSGLFYACLLAIPLVVGDYLVSLAGDQATVLPADIFTDETVTSGGRSFAVLGGAAWGLINEWFPADFCIGAGGYLLFLRFVAFRTVVLGRAAMIRILTCWAFVAIVTTGRADSSGGAPSFGVTRFVEVVNASGSVWYVDVGSGTYKWLVQAGTRQRIGLPPADDWSPDFMVGPVEGGAPLTFSVNDAHEVGVQVAGEVGSGNECTSLLFSERPYDSWNHERVYDGAQAWIEGFGAGMVVLVPCGFLWRMRKGLVNMNGDF